MPIFWGLGAVLGPVIGGTLVFPTERFPALFGENEFLKRFPYHSQTPSFFISIVLLS